MRIQGMTTASGRALRRCTRNLLVRSTNWIGDAVMTTPAVRAIRRAFPRARIVMLAKPWVAPVFEESPHLDGVMVMDTAGRHRGLTGGVRLARDLKTGTFDTAILLQNAFEAAWIVRMAGIPRRIGFDTDGRRALLTHPVRRTPAVRAAHQTAYYLGILRGIGWSGGDQRLEVTVGARRRLAADRLLERLGLPPGGIFAGLNPSAAFGPAKQWPPERYAALGDRLGASLGAATLIFGGPGDGPLGGRVAAMMRRPAVNLGGRTTLGEAMALIERCRVFVTNDSGLMHVAAALDVPLVAVFGSTDPSTTGPYSPRSRVVRTPVACSPCKARICPLGHMDCMRGVGVDQVHRAVEELL